MAFVDYLKTDNSKTLWKQVPWAFLAIPISYGLAFLFGIPQLIGVFMAGCLLIWAVWVILKHDDYNYWGLERFNFDIPEERWLAKLREWDCSKPRQDGCLDVGTSKNIGTEVV